MIFLVIGFVSCKTKSDDRSNLLVKKWLYVEFKMNDEVMTGEQFQNPVMEFFDDGKYKIEFGVMSEEEGEWKIEKDELVTTTNDGKTNRFQIVELTADKLVLHSEVEGNKAFITLAPAK